MIERLELRNFTVFTDLTLDLSPKINVIIGENGTGKTHLLKAAYGLCAGAPLFKNKPDTSKDELEAALTAKLLRLFMPLDDKLGKMHRQGATDQAYLSVRFAGGQKIAATFFNNSKALAVQNRNNIEQYQADPAQHGQDTQETLKELIQIAYQIADIAALTGRSAPNVIT